MLPPELSIASKAIHLPSGDQEGLPACVPNDVSCLQLPPSLWQIHTSSLPDRLDSNATLLPSGENLGQISLIEESNAGVASPTAAPEASRSNDQMFISRR